MIIMNKQISKGGIIGAVIGAAASTQTYKQTDSIPKKVLKTGVITGIGYFLGSIVERFLYRGHSNK